MSRMCSTWTNLGQKLPLFGFAVGWPLYIGDGRFLVYDAWMIGGGDGRLGISTDRGKTWGYTPPVNPTALGEFAPINLGNGRVWGFGLDSLGNLPEWYSTDYCDTILNTGGDILGSPFTWGGIAVGDGYGILPTFDAATGNLHDWLIASAPDPAYNADYDAPRPLQGAPYNAQSEMFNLGLKNGYAVLSHWVTAAGDSTVYYTDDYGNTWYEANGMASWIRAFFDLGNGRVLGVSTIGGIWVSPPGSYGSDWEYLGTIWGASSQWVDGAILTGINIGNGNLYATGYLADSGWVYHYGVLYSDRSGEPGSWKLIEIPAWTAALAPASPLAWDGKNTFITEWAGGVQTRSNTGGQLSTGLPVGVRGGLSLANKPTAGLGLGARIPYGTRVGGH